MDRIAASFARAHREKRAAFVAYLCAGDPTFDVSLDACRTLLRNGVDVLELGVPFSDPLADGLTNQLAAQRALASGMTSARVFELVHQLRREFPEAPIVFYTYYNLVFSNGIEAYLTAAKNAGVDGMLTLDLPPEEADEMRQLCGQAGIKTVFIVAPTTPTARIPKITAATTGFIYYVSREGVTGVRDSMPTNVPDSVRAIKAQTPLPVVVGFGVSRREHVSQIAAHADGVVVGSALVNRLAHNVNEPAKGLRELGDLVTDLAAGLAR